MTSSVKGEWLARHMEASRAVLRCVLDVLDSFMMSLEEVSLRGSSLETSSRRDGVFRFEARLLFDEASLPPPRAFQRRVDRNLTQTTRLYQHGPLEHWITVTVAGAAPSADALFTQESMASMQPTTC